MVAHKCAQLPEIFSDILLASRTEAKCEAIAKSVAKKQGRQIRTCTLDADDVAATTQLLLMEQPALLLINVACRIKICI